MDKKNNIILNIFIKITLLVIIAGLGAIYYYSRLNVMELPMHSDDAGMVYDFYNRIALGKKSLKGLLNGKYAISTGIAYLSYYFFGASYITCQIYFAIKFFLCILPGIYLSISREEKSYKLCWYVIPLYIYLVVMQGINNEYFADIRISKFHLDPVIIMLIALLILQIYEKSKKKILLGAFSFIIMYSFFLGDILSIPMIIGPIIVYLIIKIVYKYGFMKVLFISCASLPIIILIFRAIDIFILGGYFYVGYGAKYFATGNEFLNNIFVYYQGLLSMFNADITGANILSLSILSKLIRFVFVIVMYIVFIYEIVKVFNNKETDIIRIFCTLSCLITTIIYLITKEETTILSTRYVNVLLFFLPIIFFRNILNSKFINKSIILFNKQIKVTILLFLYGIILIGTIASKPIFSFPQNSLTNITKKVEEEKLQYGIGSFWSSYVINVYSNCKVNIQAVSLGNDNSVLPIMTTWIPYGDKCNTHNFIIWDEQQNSEINEKSVIEVFGEPIKNLIIEDRYLYIYNYDIRWKPVKIGYNSEYVKADKAEITDENFKINSGGKISIINQYFDMGKTRFIIQGNNLLNANISFVDENSGENLEYTVYSEEESKIIYDVETDYFDENITMSINNNSNKDVTFQLCEIQTLKKSKDIKIEGRIAETIAPVKIENSKNAEVEFECAVGTYHIIMHGDNIEKTMIKFNGSDENVLFKEITLAENRKVYEIEVLEKQKVKLNIITENSASISNLSYETIIE